jgi:hypothetical protein
MKKSMWAFFVLFTSVLFSQGFHDPINLGITIPPILSDKKVFVNKHGMHLVTANYQNSSTNGSISYYRIFPLQRINLPLNGHPYINIYSTFFFLST